MQSQIKVKEDMIDVVPLNLFEILPCVLILEILDKGKLIFYDDEGFYARQWLRMRDICLDFMLDYEKLDLHETQMRAVRRLLGL